MASTKATKSDTLLRMTKRKLDIIFYVGTVIPGSLAALGLAITTINLFTNWF